VSRSQHHMHPASAVLCGAFWKAFSKAVHDALRQFSMRAVHWSIRGRAVLGSFSPPTPRTRRWGHKTVRMERHRGLEPGMSGA
jgi:hypothetical protein